MLPECLVEVLATGTELLVGQTVNTNLTFVGASLLEHGLRVDRELALPDDAPVLLAALREALAGSRVTIMIGGLGPTDDDLSRQVAAEVLGVPLVLHEETAHRIEELYRSRHIQARAGVVYRQSLMPAGAAVLTNDWGTAPGLHCQHQGRHLFLLPGPPREFRPLFTRDVLPRLLAVLPPQRQMITINVLGQGESVIEQQVKDVLAAYPGIEPAYCVQTERGRCHVRLAAPPAEAATLAAAAAAVRAQFGADAQAPGRELTDHIGELLCARGWWLGTAESCTGGGIGRFITDSGGVSEFYRGGIVCYHNDVKQQLLGVPAATLAAHGAVSAETAEAMVRGLAERLGVQAGIAVTGIAGPGGGSPAKPVGTVYIATLAGDRVQVTHNALPGDRARVRDRAIVIALDQLRRQLLALS